MEHSEVVSPSSRHSLTNDVLDVGCVVLLERAPIFRSAVRDLPPLAHNCQRRHARRPAPATRGTPGEPTCAHILDAKEVFHALHPLEQGRLDATNSWDALDIHGVRFFSIGSRKTSTATSRRHLSSTCSWRSGSKFGRTGGISPLLRRNSSLVSASSWRRQDRRVKRGTSFLQPTSASECVKVVNPFSKQATGSLRGDCQRRGDGRSKSSSVE